MKSTFEKAPTNIIKNKSRKIARKKPFVLLSFYTKSINIEPLAKASNAVGHELGTAEAL